MNTFRPETYVRTVLVYFLFLFIGIFTVYIIECRIHMDMNEMSQVAATEVAENNCIDDYEPYLTSSILYYTEDGIETIHAYYAQKEFPFPLYVEMYKEYYDRQRTVYALPFTLRPFAFVAVSGCPVFGADGSFLGEVYLCEEITYLPEIFVAYFLLYTLLYIIIIFCVWMQWKSRHEIENIYHQYIANISHELKTPIASIQAITETLSEGLVHDEATLSRYYGIISQESRQLEHSVLQIIELSKLQDPRMEFPKEVVSPEKIFKPLEQLFASRCEDIGITFRIENIIWQLPPLYTNAARLTQLLEILLDNAFKFVADDGTITISATTKYSQATIRVEDNGCGITDEMLPHIFERFFKSTVNNPTGSGLGLAIANEIIAGLEEKIWVRTEVEKGTTFFFTVPLHKQ
ncbi:MAG: HAMP domain-containing histidine kinase [Clostridia bacterium]|nr:HAMP domain-containing histidine kinase [Clostridia bacterium]